MALSEIRVNTTKTRTGVGTITYTETGPVITGIATASNFKTGSTNVHSTGVELANINTGGADVIKFPTGESLSDIDLDPS